MGEWVSDKEYWESPAPLTEQQIDMVAGAIMRAFIAKWFTGALPKGMGVYLDCVNGERAWREEARAAIAAIQSPALAHGTK